jgi:small GTP-binding protein
MPEYNTDIKRLEDEIANTKYNKRTQHAVGMLKAKLAKLKDKSEARKHGGKKGEGYSIRRSGDASVILLGFPSVGKSTLLNALTNAKSETAAYAFTTTTVIPGMMDYEQAKIQILDVPGILKGASDGTGRGKEVLSVLRSADMALIIVEVNHPENLSTILAEVYNTDIRINQRKPDVRIRRTSRNGIRIGKTVRLENLADDTITDILKEFKINNAEVLIREAITDDQLIDIVEGNKIYMPAVIVLSKADMVSEAQAEKIKEQTGSEIIISAQNGRGMEELKRLIFQKLCFIRIYLKQPGKEPDLKEPLIMRNGVTIRAVCDKLHRDFASRFKFARIWGKSSKFPGQKLLSLNHSLADKDVLEIHLR